MLFAIAALLALISGLLLPSLRGRAHSVLWRFFVSRKQRTPSGWFATLVLIAADIPVVLITLVPWLAIASRYSVPDRQIVFTAFAAGFGIAMYRWWKRGDPWLGERRERRADRLNRS